jgi:hypothetical protein
MKYEKPQIGLMGTALEAVQAGLSKPDTSVPDGNIFTESAYNAEE